MSSTDLGTSFIISANLDVDKTGERFTASHSFTLIAPDGTILAAVQGGGGRGTRLHAEPAEAAGPLPGFPTWTPAAPEASTPTP